MIKVCGLRTSADVRHAVACGATAVGFVFWPKSPRYVAPDTAAAIVADLPRHVLSVGVFVDAPLDDVQRVAETVGLTACQLHGHEPPEYVAALAPRVIKAFGVAQAREVASWPAGSLVLLDAIDPIARGGTGTRVDWARAAALAGIRPVILAGGLTPENVGEAVAIVRPSGVDVSSGVERSPGVKDEDKVRRFVATAREALARLQRGAGQRESEA